MRLISSIIVLGIACGLAYAAVRVLMVEDAPAAEPVSQRSSLGMRVNSASGSDLHTYGAGQGRKIVPGTNPSEQVEPGGDLSDVTLGDVPVPFSLDAAKLSALELRSVLAERESRLQKRVTEEAHKRALRGEGELLPDPDADLVPLMSPGKLVSFSYSGGLCFRIVLDEDEYPDLYLELSEIHTLKHLLSEKR